MAQNKTQVRKFKAHDHAHHSADSINRLKRASGHLNKVIQMVEADKPCGDVLQQLSAVISALGGSRVQILKSHLNSCLRPVLKTKDGKLVKEIEDVIQRAMKV
jgi:DNA-binding FrmR family transcriptional regulator